MTSGQGHLKGIAVVNAVKKNPCEFLEMRGIVWVAKNFFVYEGLPREIIWVVYFIYWILLNALSNYTRPTILLYKQ